MVKSLIAFVREYGDDSRMWCPTAKDIFLAANVCAICELFQDVNGMYHVYVFYFINKERAMNACNNIKLVFSNPV